MNKDRIQNDNRKIKVLFVLNSFGTGGSERVVLDICKGLDKGRFQTFVVGMHNGELVKEFDKENIWNMCLHKKKGIDFSLMTSMYKVIKEKKIDVINAHHFSPFIHACFGFAMTRCALIYTDHTIYEIKRIPWYWKLMGTIILKFCYGVIGISDGCTKQLRKTFHVSEHKAFTVLNAIDLERFKRQVDKQQKKKELGLAPNDKVIGIVGSLREQKNHANLLHAIKLLAERSCRIKFLVIGDGQLQAELFQLSRKLGIADHVLFLGARLDVDALYKTMDIYCLCSHYEGLPLTILEAMASKLPVVGTNVEGISDIIKHGETGMLVDPNNPDALSKMFVKLLNNKSDADRLAINGYRYVIGHHHMTPWIRTYENYFSHAVQQK